MVCNRVVQVLALVSLLSSSVYTNNVAGSVSLETLRQKHVSQNQTDQSSLSLDAHDGQILPFLIDLVKRIGEVDYYTSSEVTVGLEQIGAEALQNCVNKKAKIDFGFRGSGPALLPFPKVYVKFVDTKGVSCNLPKPDMNHSALQHAQVLGTLVVQKEISRNVTNIPFLNMLSKTLELEPIHVFVLKALLLAQSEKEANSALFIQELANLFSRLYLSYPDFALNNGSLEDMVAHVISSVMPTEWSDLVNTMISSDIVGEHGVRHVLAFNKNAFVDNAGIAQDAKLYLENHGENAVLSLESFLADKGCFKVDDLVMLKNEPNHFYDKAFYLAPASALTLVDKRLGSLVVQQPDDAATIIQDEQTGIVFVSYFAKTLSLRDTLCAMVAATSRAFVTYMHIKYPAGSKIDEATQQAWSQDSDSRSCVIAFLRTEHGKISHERLQCSLSSVVKSTPNSGNVEKIDALEKLNHEITAIQQRVSLYSADLDRLDTLLAKNHRDSANIGLARYVHPFVGAELDSERKILLARQQDAQQNLDYAEKELAKKVSLRQELKKRLPENIAKKRQELRSLLEQRNNLQTKGLVVSQELMGVITTLEAELSSIDEPVAERISENNDIASIIALREQCAVCYEHEKELVLKELQDQIRGAQSSSNIIDVDAIILRSKVEAHGNLVKKYANRLASIAKNIRAENAELQRFQELRDIAESDDLPTESKQEFSKLSLRLSFILRDRVSCGISSDAFLTDMSCQQVCDEILAYEDFAPLRYDFSRNIASIVRHSYLIQDYFELFSYMADLILPKQLSHFVADLKA